MFYAFKRFLYGKEARNISNARYIAQVFGALFAGIFGTIAFVAFAYALWFLILLF